jgi:type IV pilus assembly protein PilP
MRAKALCFAVVLGLGACTTAKAPADELAAFLLELRATAPPALPPVPEAVAREPYRYSAAPLRSPFRARPGGEAGAAMAQPLAPPNPNRPRAYLERFSLAALTYVGHLEGAGQRYALVRDGTGRVHRVAPGAFLGPDHGQLMVVAPRRLTLRELIPNGLGGWQYREATLALSTGDRE